jgi:hypothetical protein
VTGWGGEWVKEDAGGVRVFILAAGEGEGSSCWALHGGAAQPTTDDGGRPEERRGTPVGVVGEHQRVTEELRDMEKASEDARSVWSMAISWRNRC